MKFSGIDLHSNNSVVVVSDEEDRIVYQKRLPNDLQQILTALLGTGRPESVLGKHAERFYLLQRHDPTDAQHALALLGEVEIERLLWSTQ